MRTKGKHSVVYIDKDKGVVSKKFKSELEYNFWKEVSFLAYLQPYNFVPKLYSIDPKNLTVTMEYIDGFTLKELVRSHRLKSEHVIKCLNFCRILDKLLIQKEEMNHPEKHVIFRNEKPYFIDFERSVITEKPSNVSQFLVYLSKIGLIELDSIIKVIKQYRKTYSENDYEKILEITRLSFKGLDS